MSAAIDQHNPITPANSEAVALHQLQKYLLHAPVAAAVIMKSDYTLCVVNERYAKAFKHPLSDLHNQCLFEVLPELKDQLKPMLDEVMDAGSVFEAEALPLKTNRNNALVTEHYDIRVEPYRNDAHAIIGVFMTGDAVRVPVQLALEQQQVSRVTDAMPVLMSYVDSSERYIFVNQLYEEWFKTPSQSIRGKTVEEFVGPDAYTRIQPYVQRALQGERISFESFVKYRDQPRHVQATYIPHKNNGAVKGFYALVADITELKKIQETIQEREEYFRRLTDTVPAMIWLTDADGRCTYLNKEWYNVTGSGKEDQLGFGWIDATHPDDAPRIHEAFGRAIVAKQEFQLRYRLKFITGEYRWVIDKGRPRFGVTGKFEGFVGSVIDVHEQVEAEERIRESEEKYKNLFNTMEQGFCIIDVIFDDAGKAVDYRFLEVNPVFGKQTGLHNAAGHTAKELLPTLEQHWFDLYGKVARTGESIMFSQGSDVMGRWFDVYAFRIGSGNRVAILFSDITSRKKAEEKLTNSERRFRALVTATTDVVYRMSADWKTMWRLEEQQFISDTGEPIQNWLDNYILPEDQPHLKLKIEKAVESKSVFELEHRILLTDGSVGWTFSKAIPILNSDGEIIEWFGTATDITAQRRAGEALKESEGKFRNLANHLEQLVGERTRELQRSNEDLQQFAHVASHDLKEPVRKVKTFIDLFKHQFNPLLPDKAKEYISKIDRASDRMNNMIEGVLQYSSVNAADFLKGVVNLTTVVESVEHDLEMVIAHKNASIVKRNLPMVAGSEFLLYQLFYNLINNALKFAKRDVPPMIELEGQEPTTEDLAHLPRQNEMRFAKVLVMDNGIGFEDEDATNIFGTFTRLHSKDKYEGTGLGLALCRNIVLRHNGAIYAHGKQGKGATFTILLPFA